MPASASRSLADMVPVLPTFPDGMNACYLEHRFLVRHQKLHREASGERDAEVVIYRNGQ